MGGHVVVDKELDVLKACTIHTQDIWWLITYTKNEEIKYKYFLSSSREQRPELIEFVKSLKENNIPHIIFAIWHGKQRTDAFLIKGETLLKVLENERH